MSSKIRWLLDYNKMKTKQIITRMSLLSLRKASLVNNLVNKTFSSNNSTNSYNCSSRSRSRRRCYFSPKRKVFNLILINNQLVINSFMDHRRKKKKKTSQSIKKDEADKIKMYPIEFILLSSSCNKKTKSFKKPNQDLTNLLTLPRQ